MPEIKEITKVEEKKVEKLFELPIRKRYSAWHFVVPILLIIALAAGWFAHALIPSANAPEANVIEKDDTNESETNLVKSTAYYLTSATGDNDKDHPYLLYKYVPNSELGDMKVGEINEKTLYILGHYTSPHTYLVSNSSNQISILDATTGKMELLLELDAASLIRDVAISADKKWLAYGKNYEGSGNGKSGGEIWVYNFETKTQKQIIPKTELGLYQGFSVLGWRDNDKELIVSSLGGDGPATWGDISQVNIATGIITNIRPVAEKDTMSFLRGQLSPNGDKWLFNYCDKVDDVAIERGDAGDLAACTSGAELRVYDFANKKIKTVYQNLRFDNNVYKSSLRVIGSFKWQDDSTIIAMVPGAILEISSLDSVKAVEVYTFDFTDPQNFKNTYRIIRSANKDRIVFNSDLGWEVFDRSSKKLVNVNPNGRSEGISDWLD